MKKLIIDLDDVICGKGFLYLVNQYLNTNYDEDEIKVYYLQNLIAADKLDDFYKFFAISNMYEHSVIVPNAVEVIEKLNEKYEVYICSSPVVPGLDSELGTFIKYKYEWLYKNLPFIKPEQIIFMVPKHMLDADIRIDDRLSNLDGPASLKILFTAYHNKDVSNDELTQNNVIRANNWLEIEKLLL